MYHIGSPMFERFQSIWWPKTITLGSYIGFDASNCTRPHQFWIISLEIGLFSRGVRYIDSLIAKYLNQSVIFITAFKRSVLVQFKQLGDCRSYRCCFVLQLGYVMMTWVSAWLQLSLRLVKPTFKILKASCQPGVYRVHGRLVDERLIQVCGFTCKIR